MKPKLTLRVSFWLMLVVAVCGCSTRNSVTSLPKYHGQTRRVAEASLGPPLTTDTFPASQAVDEMRRQLLYTYPLSNPANANVMIQESHWKDGDYWIALWFHQVNGEWVVLDSCRWHKDVVF